MRKMSLNYHRVSKHPRNFRDITGLKIEEFEKIVEKVRPEWKKLEKQKKRHGRIANLPTLEDKMLCVILYYLTYITHRFLGCLFNLHNANICRLLKKKEPLWAKKITIKKDRTLTPERILKILADVTEQQPKECKKRKISYSGKKKMTTMKTEIVIVKSAIGFKILPWENSRFSDKKTGEIAAYRQYKVCRFWISGMAKVAK